MAQLNGIAPYNGGKWRDLGVVMAREELLNLIGRFPEGASLEELLLGYPTVPRRTLQRRLAQMVAEGEILAAGSGRARKYHLATPLVKAEPPSSPLPLTKEGSHILSEVSKPIQKRRPVGYHREFLERYRPNQTFYLSASVRKRLLELGNSGGGTYPAGTYARKMFGRLLIDLSWNSSRLEGNTYSLLETIRLLEKGKAAEGKDLEDTQMLLNHKAAIEFLIHSAEDVGVNRFTILNLHTLLSDNLMSDPAASGRLRSIPVGIAKSVYSPSPIPQVVEECFTLLIQKANEIEDPIEQAFFLMVQLPYLQPFDDVNKRTSRLAANIPLIQKNLCPLSFINVPESIYIAALLGVYELNRTELMEDLFVWAYEQSCSLYSTARRSLGEPDPFRMKYRDPMQQTILAVVRGEMDRQTAVREIRKRAATLPLDEQARFIEIIERELESLHEGNIARYQLRLSEYESWKKIWVRDC